MFYAHTQKGFIMKVQLLIAALAITVLSGCSAKPTSVTAMPPMTPPQTYTEPEQRAANPGSMYSAAESADLYADSRARTVGDIVMIKIVENSKSKSKADTNAGRTSGANIDVTSAFGKGSMSPLLGAGPLSGDVGTNPLLTTSYGSNLKATGETKRENYVTATIGARVLQILPGGVLQVQGAREIRVNEETQYMVVTGLVRSKDVAADNSVESTQLADSKIEYYGKGVLADKQRAGWLTRLLDNVWPF